MIATGETLFVCPRCGKPTLSVHRKTYERTVIFNCNSCRLNTEFEPSKEAYFDAAASWQEFTAQQKHPK